MNKLMKIIALTLILKKHISGITQNLRINTL